MRFTIIDAPQRSAAWFTARAGRLTGSVAGDMLSKLKDGKPAASRKNLALRLMLERVTGKPVDDGFVKSAAMQAGIDREDDAFTAYEMLTGNLTQRSGFLALTTVMAGCSLDGHIGNFERLLSIKCRQPAAHLDFLKSGTIPSDAMAQLRHELWITGALEHDYFSWNPDFPAELQSKVVTVPAASCRLSEYEADAMAFLAEVEKEVAHVNELVEKARAA